MLTGPREVLPTAGAAADVSRVGWRLLLGGAYTSVAVASLPMAVEVATAAVLACGSDASMLRLDLRADCVDLVVRTSPFEGLTAGGAALTARISSAVRDLGLITSPRGTGNPAQVLEIAIDAMNLDAVLPFWRAVFGYVVLERPTGAGQHELVATDPAGRGPTVWLQQLEAPRPQRNRVHFDLTVAEDEAEDRVSAVLAAGGRLVSDKNARAFWVVADPEGNEVCICTWQDRD